MKRRSFMGAVLASFLAACSRTDEPAVGDTASTADGSPSSVTQPAQPTTSVATTVESAPLGVDPLTPPPVVLPADAFALGVASGEPDDGSVVVWTRLLGATDEAGSDRVGALDVRGLRRAGGNRGRDRRGGSRPFVSRGCRRARTCEPILVSVPGRRPGVAGGPHTNDARDRRRSAHLPRRQFLPSTQRWRMGRPPRSGGRLGRCRAVARRLHLRRLSRPVGVPSGLRHLPERSTAAAVPRGAPLARVHRRPRSDERLRRVCRPAASWCCAQSVVGAPTNEAPATGRERASPNPPLLRPRRCRPPRRSRCPPVRRRHAAVRR